jgi:hypothetical protein
LVSAHTKGRNNVAFRIDQPLVSSMCKEPLSGSLVKIAK